MTIKEFMQMNKKEKLYNLRAGISVKSERIKFLLQNIIFKSESKLETEVLADLALDETNRISKMSEKIGKILNH
jgi:hypothetical protein